MQPEILATGIGVLSAAGQGKPAFASALLAGESAFGIMQRPGRQSGSAYIGAELPEIAFPPSISKQTVRAASLSAQAALVALDEAWAEARLSDVEPRRIGLVVGGSNVQQRELVLVHESYRDRAD
ncbi:MAG TPA: beta-ketoacyl synthase N-terminal-like domain-containing protein, partial [Thermoanaerobaculia bacterium]|nr:beta-ketoacyl synthase N-terminal-like domain-containing protein [Thermoanaerobaculia bacterium]